MNEGEKELFSRLLTQIKNNPVRFFIVDDYGVLKLAQEKEKKKKQETKRKKVE